MDNLSMPLDTGQTAVTRQEAQVVVNDLNELLSEIEAVIAEETSALAELSPEEQEDCFDLKAANSLAEECRQLVSQAKAVTESDEITLGQKMELVSLIGRSLKISTEFGWLLAAGLEDELLPSEVMELGEVAQLSAMLAGIIN